MSEKLSSIESSITKAFTTEQRHKRKSSIDISRKGSIVKEKCTQLTEIALELFPDRKIPEEELAYLVKCYCGADKETVRAYMGYYGTMKRSKISGEGYVLGASRKGYLEILGLMHRISRTKWLIHAQMRLPEAPSGLNTNEGLEVSKEKISLSHNVEVFPQGERARENRIEEVVSLNEEDDYNNNNNNTTERERNFAPKISQRLDLTPEEEAILNAIPVDSQPDRSKPIRRVDSE
jgi:hypothetical protein